MKKVLLFGLALFLNGCAPNSLYTRLTDTSYPPNENWQSIAVYTEKDEIPGKFEKIAIVMAPFEKMGTGLETTGELKMDQLKMRAGELGANALLIDRLEKDYPNFARAFAIWVGPPPAEVPAKVGPKPTKVNKLSDDSDIK